MTLKFPGRQKEKTKPNFSKFSYMHIYEHLEILSLSQKNKNKNEINRNMRVTSIEFTWSCQQSLSGSMSQSDGVCMNRRKKKILNGSCSIILMSLESSELSENSSDLIE